MIDDIKPLLKKFIYFAKDNLNFQRPPRLFLKQDTENQKCMLGKTAHYDPSNSSITLYISGRHPKDILRSFAHELVHHCQNERGDLAPEKMKTMNKNYAQENDHMRKMEKEAYLMGNMCFRDWEDGLDDKTQYKMKIAEQKFLKENKTMSVKISKKDLKNLIQKLLESKLEESDCGSRKDKKKKGYMEEGEDCKSCGGTGCADCKPLEENEELEETAMPMAKEPKGQDLNNDGKEGSGEVPAFLVKKGSSEEGSSEETEKESENGETESESGSGETENKSSGLTKAQQKLNPGLQKAIAANKKTANEGFKIRTPEQENTLYESRFTQRNTRLFEKLLKEWTK